ncbi:hypothetical protein ZEAMMB73_Zm00001d040772 [Zea mays]|uniref:Transmembrane protein n=1 Tax=Zea mays TaxID=4577 RepID=A0A1D6MSW2_MAIZE|nr:hypothetical protein ZEAMMB73_Zm00001d040772 [Zea mays]
MSRGGSAGGGHSSLGYLFGSGEPPNQQWHQLQVLHLLRNHLLQRLMRPSRLLLGLPAKPITTTGLMVRTLSTSLRPSEDLETKKTSIAVIIVVSVLASVLVVTALFGGFRYWQKKKRERDQARFLKLFEEGDDLEDELGLSNEF